MAPVAPVSSWIPEDDILLKNAVEAGASLEALAKGAVHFSRKFTVRELQDRWRSLLYDPVISAEASGRMLEFELSAPNDLSKSHRFNNSREITAKRKPESIHSLYYRMRKRMYNQAVNPFDLGFLGSPNYTACTGNGGDSERVGMDVDNNLIDYGNCMGPHPHGFPDIPVLKRREDVSKAGWESDQDVQEMQGGVQIAVEAIGSSDILGYDISDHPDSLLNIPNEDEILFMEFDGKGVMEEAVDSLLLNSPTVYSKDTSDADEHQALVSNKDHLLPEDLSTLVLVDITDFPPDSVHGSHETLCHPDDNRQSLTFAPSSHSPLNQGEMNCILNSEDLEIPCNEDMFPSKTIRPSFVDDTDLFSSSVRPKNHELEMTLKREDNPKQLGLVARILESDILSKSSPNDRPFNHEVKKENRDGYCLSAVTRHVNSFPSSPKTCMVEHGTSKSATSNALKEEDGQSAVGEQVILLVDPGSSRAAVGESEGNTSTLDLEELDTHDNFPSFSDIEAMILEMDLWPNDHELYVNKEVLRYQHEDTKRKIMRLEQCARSATQRTIASKGAFAILYGRHVKHYIKKAEVMLGRSTNDYKVDIDLRREGRANQISRRQAVIRMQKDGSFVLKNHGKNPVFINGKEVGTGQLRSLSSNSLIELREIALVFETNPNSVRQYLTKLTRNKLSNS